jgi:hypothetical protein
MAALRAESPLPCDLARVPPPPRPPPPPSSPGRSHLRRRGPQQPQRDVRVRGHDHGVVPLHCTACTTCTRTASAACTRTACAACTAGTANPHLHRAVRAQGLDRRHRAAGAHVRQVCREAHGRSARPAGILPRSRHSSGRSLPQQRARRRAQQAQQQPALTPEDAVHVGAAAAGDDSPHGAPHHVQQVVVGPEPNQADHGEGQHLPAWVRGGAWLSVSRVGGGQGWGHQACTTGKDGNCGAGGNAARRVGRRAGREVLPLPYPYPTAPCSIPTTLPPRTQRTCPAGTLHTEAHMGSR